MKLTKEDYQDLVDKSLVELEDAIKKYKDGEPIVSNEANLKRLKKVSKLADELYYTYDAMIDAELEEQAEEAEREYKIKFGDDK